MREDSRMKVAIEKYYKEIGSLSSCFGNGFKWLYLIPTNPTQYEKIAKIDGKNEKKYFFFGIGNSTLYRKTNSSKNLIS